MRALWLRFLLYLLKSHPDVAMVSVVTKKEIEDMAHMYQEPHEWNYNTVQGVIS